MLIKSLSRVHARRKEVEASEEGADQEDHHPWQVRPESRGLLILWWPASSGKEDPEEEGLGGRRSRARCVMCTSRTSITTDNIFLFLLCFFPACS